MQAKKLWTLFSTFFKIGLFTFGGGYAMIAQVKESIVEKKQWMTEEEFLWWMNCKKVMKF